jgi:hypothetical protein
MTEQNDARNSFVLRPLWAKRRPSRIALVGLRKAAALSRSADTLHLGIQEDILLMSDRTVAHGALFCGFSIER